MRRTAKALLLLAACAAGLALWREGPPGAGRGPWLDSIAREAIELQCRSAHQALRENCEREAAKALRAGSFDPEVVLRVHCTRFDNGWTPGPAAAPDLCVERYGGWIER